MCDPGEKVSQTLKREFMEEATDSTGSNNSKTAEIAKHLNSLFEKGIEVVFMLDIFFCNMF
jgi:hypothetical protein